MTILDVLRAAVGLLFRLGGWVAERLHGLPAARKPAPARYKIIHHPDHGFAALRLCEATGDYRVITRDGTLGVYEESIAARILLADNFLPTEQAAGFRINAHARGTTEVWTGD